MLAVIVFWTQNVSESDYFLEKEETFGEKEQIFCKNVGVN